MKNINSGRKKYKVVDKKRFISFILGVFLIVLCITLIFTKRNKVYSSIYEYDYIELKIESGDTLWDIAKDNMPEEYDIRKMVFEIIKFNNLDDAYIYPGDLIKIPIK